MRRIAPYGFALLVACGGPGGDEIPPDLCGPNGECPAGYVCNPVDNRCYLRSTTPDARGPDAPPSDNTAPDTTITGKPSAISGPSVTFLFEASEPATFECSLDGAAFAACASPLNLSGLAATPDPHVFAVRARDLAGNVDETPASYSWTVDPNALDTSILQAPPATSGPDVSFSFSSTRPGTFECRLQPTDADFATCTSPKSYSGLTGDGTTQPYTFAVRAVDIAGARDDSPATYVWYVDTTPPVVHIVAPTGTTNARPTIQLTTEVGATYTCAIDGGAPFACGASTPVPADLGDGPHTLLARGVDARGNNAEDSGTWTVDATPPTITLTGPNDGSTTGKQVTFTYTVSDGTSSCVLDGAAPAGGCGSPVALTISTSGSHTFAVTAVDAVGNSRTAQRTWTVDATPPTINLIGPTNGAVTSGSNLKFISSVSDGTRTCVLGPAGGTLGVVDCDVAFARGLGDWTYRVTAVDAVGNQSSVTRTWTVADKCVPQDLSIVSPQAGAKQDNPVWLSFVFPTSFCNSGDIVDPATKLFECMIDWKNPVPCYVGVYGFSLANVAVGQHTVSVRATVGTRSIVHNGYFELSASAPAFAVTEPARGSTVPAPLVLDHNGGNIQCQLDGAAPQACLPGGTSMYPSPGVDHNLHFLLAGGHTYDHGFWGAPVCGRVTDADTVAQWPMEGAQRVEDASGNGRHLFLGTDGTIESSDPTYVTGRISSAISFDDTSARLTATTPNHSFPDGMTIEAWVNPPAAGPVGILLAPTLAAGQQHRLVLELLGNRQIQARIEGTTSQVAGFPPFNCWVHVMATYDPAAGQLHLYLDRFADFTTPVASGTTLGTVNGYTLGPFTGPGVGIDDVRITSRARTATELPQAGCIVCTTP